MADNTEQIGGVSVAIEGDYSGLRSDFDEAVAIAVQEGKTLAEAIQDAMKVPDTAPVTEAITNVGTSAETAAGGLHEFGGAAQEAGHDSHEAAEGAGEFLKSLLEFAGIELSIEALKEFAKEAVEVYAETERTEIALTFLRGSAEGAAQEMDHLREVAMHLALPVEDLERVTQRMAAFGFTTEQTNEAVKAAADAAAATGNSFESAATKLSNMALSGAAGARQLTQLGLSATDLAAVMGVSLSEVADNFRRLTEESRLDVLIAALEKFKGAGEELANSTSGQMQRVKNAWHDSMEEVGKALAPIIVKVIGFAADMAYYFSVGVTSVVADAKVFVETLKAVDSASTLHFSEAKAHLQEAAKIQTEAQKAIQGIIDRHDKLGESAEDAGKKVVLNYQEMGKAAYEYKALADGALNPLGTAILAAEYARLNKQFKDAADYIAWYKLHADALNKALHDLDLTTQPVIETQSNLSRASDDAAKMFDKLKLSAVDAAKQALAESPWGKIAADLKVLGLQVDDVAGTVQTKAITAFRDLADSELSTLPMIEAGWAAVSGRVDKLARYDLPAAIDAYNDYIDALQRTGAPLGAIYEAQQKELELEIRMKEQRGESANAEVIALTNIKLKTDALKESTHLLGDMYAGVINAVLRGWDQLGKSIADNIVDGKNWGDVFKGVLQSVEKQILEQLVGTAFKALKDAILENTGLLGSLGGIVSKIFGGAGGGAMSEAPGAVSGVAGSGGGIGGAASGAAGAGITGIIGAAGSVVGAISGIIGNFQSAHMETSLNAIEHNTRYTMMYVGERADGGILGVLFKIQEDLSFGTIVKAAEASRDFLEDVRNIVNDIRGALTPGVVWGGAAAPAGQVAGPASQQTSIVNAPIHIHESSNPRQTARAVADHLRKVSPQFRAASA